MAEKEPKGPANVTLCDRAVRKITESKTFVVYIYISYRYILVYIYILSF
jgi:hypothetical protein